MRAYRLDCRSSAIILSAIARGSIRYKPAAILSRNTAILSPSIGAGPSIDRNFRIPPLRLLLSLG